MFCLSRNRYDTVWGEMPCLHCNRYSDVAESQLSKEKCSFGRIEPAPFRPASEHLINWAKLEANEILQIWAWFIALVFKSTTMALLAICLGFWCWSSLLIRGTLRSLGDPSLVGTSEIPCLGKRQEMLHFYCVGADGAVTLNVRSKVTET